MRSQPFLELLWPSRYDPAANVARRMAMLQAIIAVAIALAAGPEVFAAMEMTVLQELLGPILFLTAFGAGAKLVALSVWRWFCRTLLPAPQVALLRSDASIPAKALALIFITVHALWYLALAVEGRPGLSAWPSDTVA
jgi:hypothetical protein